MLCGDILRFGCRREFRRRPVHKCGMPDGRPDLVSGETRTTPAAEMTVRVVPAQEEVLPRAAGSDLAEQEATLPTEEPPECFICTSNQPPPWPSDCNCKNRYMHASCQRKFLEGRSDITCPVCLVPYGNVTYKSRRRFNWYSSGVFAVMIALAILSILACTLNTFFALAKKKRAGSDSTTLLVFGCSLGSFTVILSACWVAFVYRQGGCRALCASCVGDEQVKTLTITKPKPKPKPKPAEGVSVELHQAYPVPDP